MTLRATHFTLAEFACKDGTPYPRAWVTTRLQPLVDVLETLRTEFEQPITITSGFRTEAYNRQIGGARHSQHVQGRAADIQVKGVTPARVAARVLALYQAGTISLGGLGTYPRWIHLDTRSTPRLVRWSGTRASP